MGRGRLRRWAAASDSLYAVHVNDHKNYKLDFVCNASEEYPSEGVGEGQAAEMKS